MKERKRIFTISTGKRMIELDKIIYIESNLHKIYIYEDEEDEISVSYMTLDKAEKKINDSCFLRIHKSFLVNMTYINELINNKIVMKNGLELYIAERRITEVKNKYRKFKRNNSKHTY